MSNTKLLVIPENEPDKLIQVSTVCVISLEDQRIIYVGQSNCSDTIMSVSSDYHSPNSRTGNIILSNDDPRADTRKHQGKRQLETEIISAQTKPHSNFYPLIQDITMH